MTQAPINPEVLVVARESRGRTQKEIAEAAGVTQGLISKVEHGLTTLDAKDLDAIARFLNYPTQLFFEQGRVREVGSACLYHRKRKTLPAKVLRKLDARMYMRNINLRRLLDELDIEGDRTFHTMDPDEYGGDPIEVARALRAAWRVPPGPIPNLTALIESAGGVVMMDDFGTHKLFGMSCWTMRGHPFFFLNAAMPTADLRWTMAHELGHLTMHATPPDGDQEEQADAFAGEFLAPEGLLRPHLRRLDFDRLPSLKAYWRLSMKALIKRAQVLGAVDVPTATRLYKQWSARRYHTNEAFPLSAEPPTLIGRAVQVHLQDHGYTREELAEALRLRVGEFSKDFMGDPRYDENVISLFRASDLSTA
jgi:Zn-dependent peptidase ImmA (M78 family)/transcriptional regulator with XRE-family HTH domain